MNKALINCLVQLGCNEKHIRFYRANLELGAATLSDIIKHARLQRSTAYVIAGELITKGLAEEDHKTYRKRYVVLDPDTLLRKLEAKHRKIGRDALALKEVLPELRAQYQTTNSRPRVRTFEDRNALIAVWRDVLQGHQEVLLWSNQHTEQLIFDPNMHDQFIQERTAKQIPIRVLAVDNPRSHELIGLDHKFLRQTRILPPQFQFTGETYIYGNTVAVLDLGKNIFGVITENEQIAEAQRAIFDFTWQQVA